jgi:hypothetical protein
MIRKVRPPAVGVGELGGEQAHERRDERAQVACP